MEHIGEEIRRQRLNLRLDIEFVVNKVNIEKDRYEEIEKYGVGVTNSLILEFEKVLGIPLKDMYDSYNDFNVLQANKSYLELRNAIERRNNDDILKCIEKCDGIEQFREGESRLLLSYAKSLMALVIHKNYEKSFEIALNALEVENILEATAKITDKIETNSFYSIFVSLCSNLYMMNLREEGMIVYEKLFEHFDKVIFKTKDNVIYQSEFLKRVFITIINNYADFCFTLNRFDKSLELCEIGLQRSFELNKSHMIDYIVSLKVEVNYMLEDYEYSKKNYQYLKDLVKYSNNAWLLERIDELVETKYPLLKNVIGEQSN